MPNWVGGGPCRSCARGPEPAPPHACADVARRAPAVPHRRDRTVVGHARPPRRAATRPVRDVRVRPRHLRPGDVVAVARARSVHHRARARGVRSPRQRDPLPARAVLPTRCRTALLVARAGRRAGERRVRGVPARARSSRTTVGSRAALGVVYLLHPTSQWLVWEFFHPDAVSIGPLLFAYWASRERRWQWFAVAAVLAAMCKEDVALVLVIIGSADRARGDRRIGFGVSAGSLGWYVVATRVVIPWQNGIGPFYDSFFGTLGTTPSGVAYNVVRHPGAAWDVVRHKDRAEYLWHMLGPLAFVPLLSPSTFAIAVPMLAVDLLTSFPYARRALPLLGARARRGHDRDGRRRRATSDDPDPARARRRDRRDVGPRERRVGPVADLARVPQGLVAPSLRSSPGDERSGDARGAGERRGQRARTSTCPTSRTGCASTSSRFRGATSTGVCAVRTSTIRLACSGSSSTGNCSMPTAGAS